MLDELNTPTYATPPIANLIVWFEPTLLVTVKISIEPVSVEYEFPLFNLARIIESAINSPSLPSKLVISIDPLLCEW